MDTRHVFIFTIRTYRNIKNILVTVGDFYMQTNDKLITELMMDIYEGKHNCQISREDGFGKMAEYRHLLPVLPIIIR